MEINKVVKTVVKIIIQHTYIKVYERQKECLVLETLSSKVVAISGKTDKWTHCLPLYSQVIFLCCSGVLLHSAQLGVLCDRKYYVQAPPLCCLSDIVCVVVGRVSQHHCVASVTLSVWLKVGAVSITVLPQWCVVVGRVSQHHCAALVMLRLGKPLCCELFMKCCLMLPLISWSSSLAIFSHFLVRFFGYMTSAEMPLFYSFVSKH